MLNFSSEGTIFFSGNENKEKYLNSTFKSNLPFNKCDESEKDIGNLFYFNPEDFMSSDNSDDFLLEEINKYYNLDKNEFNSINYDISQSNKFIGKKHNLNDENFAFIKNRNNLNNNLFKISYDKIGMNSLTNLTSSSNCLIKKYKNNSSNIRSDSLLIKFKSFLGKSFIKHINNKLKKIAKRRIKFFSFNYKKFTLNVSYAENKKWLNEKMKNLIVLGGEVNQTKNEKSLKSLYKKKDDKYNEVKKILELTYKEVIERFYSSKYFEEFKNNEKVQEMDKNFIKIMEESILEKNGFINFIEKRKGNKENVLKMKRFNLC